METEMMRISNQSRKYAKVENLMCRVSAQTLMQQHKKQKAKKAVGVDHVDKAKYDERGREYQRTGAANETFSI